MLGTGDCSGCYSSQRGKSIRSWVPWRILIKGIRLVSPGNYLWTNSLLINLNRAYALQKHRPLTLHATIGLPTVDVENPNATTGFIHLVNLYRPFDDTFIGLWNKSRSDCSTYWLARLQQQLTEALPNHLKTTDSQAADLRTSQQWLRTMVWQLSITNGFISSTSPDKSLTFQYPIEIAQDLVAVTTRLPKQSMEVHGIGLVSVPNMRLSMTRLIWAPSRSRKCLMWPAPLST